MTTTTKLAKKDDRREVQQDVKFWTSPRKMAPVWDGLAFYADMFGWLNKFRLREHGEALRKCTTDARCGLLVCPDCLGLRLDRRAAMVERLQCDARANAADVVQLNIPKLVLAKDLEATLSKVCKVTSRLTRSGTPWTKQFIRWVGATRIQVLPCAHRTIPLSFQFSVRVVAERRAPLDLRELGKYCSELLNDEGLTSSDPLTSSRSIVIRRGGSELARWIFGSRKTWLGPVRGMDSDEVSRYEDVLSRLFKAVIRSR
jgi:hypothetical protein